MSRATVIARRELSSYFYSPIAYVALFLFGCAKFATTGESAPESEPEGQHALPEPAE